MVAASTIMINGLILKLMFYLQDSYLKSSKVVLN